jgi:hypothetical protein
MGKAKGIAQTKDQRGIQDFAAPPSTIPDGAPQACGVRRFLEPARQAAVSVYSSTKAMAPPPTVGPRPMATD